MKQVGREIMVSFVLLVKTFSSRGRMMTSFNFDYFIILLFLYFCVVACTCESSASVSLYLSAYLQGG